MGGESERNKYTCMSFSSLWLLDKLNQLHLEGLTETCSRISYSLPGEPLGRCTRVLQTFPSREWSHIWEGYKSRSLILWMVLRWWIGNKDSLFLVRKDLGRTHSYRARSSKQMKVHFVNFSHNIFKVWNSTLCHIVDSRSLHEFLEGLDISFHGEEQTTKSY